jgi:DNA primase
VNVNRGSDKDLVKARVSLRDVVAEVVGDLRSRGGDDLWACCPFHRESTPSFHIRPALGIYKCFGCHESGDVFSFVMKMRGIGFREALTVLAERAGIELESISPEDRRRHTEARASRAVLDVALKLFRKELMSPTGRGALHYMRSRGFTDDLLARFDIGFIPRDFLRTLRAPGSEQVEQSQLDGAGFTAAFGGRVCFGIRDGNGALVGFGARKLVDDGDGPKYVNTRETPWFAKGRLLYGLDKASRTLSRTRRLVVMEGYTDVMMAHQAGLEEAVATMGTSFTSDHLALVKARVGNLVLVFDGDGAGQQAAERASRMVLAEGIECRVLILPLDMDPFDWFGSHTRADFDVLLDQQAVSNVTWICQRGVSALDRGHPGGREQVAREVLEAARTITDPLRRDTVVADIARVCGVDRNLLRRQAGGPVSPAAAQFPRRARVAGRPVNALVRSAFVAVAGLAHDPGRRELLTDLVAEGALPHDGARAVLDIGLRLLAEGGRLDISEWLDDVRESLPAEADEFEHVLLPPPERILCSWDEAVAHLRGRRSDELSQEQKRLAMSRPDIASRSELLRDLQSRLAGPARPGGVSTSPAPHP